MKNDNKRLETIKWIINEINRLVVDENSLDLLNEINKSSTEIHNYIGFPSSNDNVIWPGDTPRIESGKQIQSTLRQWLLRPGMFTGTSSNSKKSKDFIHRIKSIINKLNANLLYKWINSNVNTICRVTSKDLAISLIKIAFRIKNNKLDNNINMFLL